MFRVEFIGFSPRDIHQKNERIALKTVGYAEMFEINYEFDLHSIGTKLNPTPLTAKPRGSEGRATEPILVLPASSRLPSWKLNCTRRF